MNVIQLLTNHNYSANVTNTNDELLQAVDSHGVLLMARAPVGGGFELADEDEVVFEACLDLIHRHAEAGHLKVANVYMGTRVPEDDKPWRDHGWLEHLVVMEYAGGSRLTVGVLQRTVGATVERHS